MPTLTRFLAGPQVGESPGSGKNEAYLQSGSSGRFAMVWRHDVDLAPLFSFLPSFWVQHQRAVRGEPARFAGLLQ
jgi:hypothetical protein